MRVVAEAELVLAVLADPEDELAIGRGGLDLGEVLRHERAFAGARLAPIALGIGDVLAGDQRQLGAAEVAARRRDGGTEVARIAEPVAVGIPEDRASVACGRPR